MEDVARAKATITLDRGKAARAVALVGAPSVSEAVDIALERLIRAEELRRDIAAYGASPPTAEELTLGNLPVDFDLGDEQTDYEALYRRQS